MGNNPKSTSPLHPKDLRMHPSPSLNEVFAWTPRTFSFIIPFSVDRLVRQAKFPFYRNYLGDSNIADISGTKSLAPDVSTVFGSQRLFKRTVPISAVPQKGLLFIRWCQ